MEIFGCCLRGTGIPVEHPEFRMGVKIFPEPEFRLGNRSSGWGFFRTLVFLVFGFLGEPVIRRSASVPVRLTGTPEIGIQASNHPTLSRRYRLEYDQQPEYDRFDRSG
ncbi:hypothetical protein CsatA_001502 [Cannabis sativa]